MSQLPKMGQEIYESYGIPDNQEKQYELDHLVALQLGGSNESKNLWSMSKSEHALKTVLDNKLASLVCKEHALTLKQAQIAVKNKLKLSHRQAVLSRITSPIILFVWEVRFHKLAPQVRYYNRLIA